MLQLSGGLQSFPAAFTTFTLVSFAFYDQTVLVFVVSVESAARDVCAAPVSIMLSFSVTLLGASLRCRRRCRRLSRHAEQHNNIVSYAKLNVCLKPLMLFVKPSTCVGGRQGHYQPLGVATN